MVQLLIYTYMKRKHLCKSSILFTFERVTHCSNSALLFTYTSQHLQPKQYVCFTKITILCLNSSRRAKTSKSDLHLHYNLSLPGQQSQKKGNIKGENDGLKDTQLCASQFLIYCSLIHLCINRWREFLKKHSQKNCNYYTGFSPKENLPILKEYLYVSLGFDQWIFFRVKHLLMFKQLQLPRSDHYFFWLFSRDVPALQHLQQD